MNKDNISVRCPRTFSTMIIFLFLSACVSSTVTPSIKNNSPSPDTIAQYIYNKDYIALEKALKQLEIKSPQSLLDLVSTGESSIIEPTSVQRTSVKTNDHEYSLLLVKVQYWRIYLIFRLDEEKWKFLGEVELTADRRETDYRIITDNRNEAWVVIRAVSGHGTGVFVYDESWYSLNGESLEVVIRYPVDMIAAAGGIPAGTSDYPADVEVKGDADYWQEDDVFHVRVLYEATYSFFEGQQDHYLFRIDQNDSYVWNPVDNRFLKEPGASQNEDTIGFHSRDELLKYAYDQLLELAKNGDKAQRQWLKQVLNSANDESEEKANLLKALSSP